MITFPSSIPQPPSLPITAHYLWSSIHAIDVYSHSTSPHRWPPRSTSIPLILASIPIHSLSHIYSQFHICSQSHIYSQSHPASSAHLSISEFLTISLHFLDVQGELNFSQEDSIPCTSHIKSLTSRQLSAQSISPSSSEFSAHLLIFGSCSRDLTKVEKISPSWPKQYQSASLLLWASRYFQFFHRIQWKAANQMTIPETANYQSSLDLWTLCFKNGWVELLDFGAR
jgi:hypothetical protein